MQRPRSGSGDTGAALDVASAAVAGKREVPFAPSDLECRSVESVVVKLAEIGDTVRAAVLPNIPMRCARAGVAHSRVLALDEGRGEWLALSDFNDQLSVTGCCGCGR